MHRGQSCRQRHTQCRQTSRRCGCMMLTTADAHNSLDVRPRSVMHVACAASVEPRCRSPAHRAALRPWPAAALSSTPAALPRPR
eukprot:8257531-Alexandrium_andersonii.AAC.1